MTNMCNRSKDEIDATDVQTSFEILHHTRLGQHVKPEEENARNNMVTTLIDKT